MVVRRCVLGGSILLAWVHLLLTGWGGSVGHSRILRSLRRTVGYPPRGCIWRGSRSPVCRTSPRADPASGIWRDGLGPWAISFWRYGMGESGGSSGGDLGGGMDRAGAGRTGIGGGDGGDGHRVVGPLDFSTNPTLAMDLGDG